MNACAADGFNVAQYALHKYQEAYDRTASLTITVAERYELLMESFQVINQSFVDTSDIFVVFNEAQEQLFECAYENSDVEMMNECAKGGLDVAKYALKYGNAPQLEHDVYSSYIELERDCYYANINLIAGALNKERNSAEILRFLLAHKVSYGETILLPNGESFTPLPLTHLVARGVNVYDATLLEEVAVEHLEVLAEFGILQKQLNQPNDTYPTLQLGLKDISGLTPLFYSFNQMHINTFDYLVERGADVSVKAKMEFSLLHAVTYPLSYDTDMDELRLSFLMKLLDKGLGVHDKDGVWGCTPLGACSFYKTIGGETLGAMKALVDAGANVNDVIDPDRSKYTPPTSGLSDHLGYLTKGGKSALDIMFNDPDGLLSKVLENMKYNATKGTTPEETSLSALSAAEYLVEVGCQITPRTERDLIVSCDKYELLFAEIGNSEVIKRLRKICSEAKVSEEVDRSDTEDGASSVCVTATMPGHKRLRGAGAGSSHVEALASRRELADKKREREAD